jgi:transposase InsO family protein
MVSIGYQGDGDRCAYRKPHPQPSSEGGIRDKPIAPGSRWQNGFAERLIGSIRRECLDHLVVLGEAYLRQILQSYADYYNNIRTHRSLGKDAPYFRPVHRVGNIASYAILGGLHHHYARD